MDPEEKTRLKTELIQEIEVPSQAEILDALMPKIKEMLEVSKPPAASDSQAVDRVENKSTEKGAEK